DLEGPVNIGSPQYNTVDELVETVVTIAEKNVNVRHIKGPVGVQARNFSNDRIYSIGWRSRFELMAGIALTYPWIKEQVMEARS
ncbi:MAG: NAD-dependent epimerase/dehydratase family protein, partial [bacterium]